MRLVSPYLFILGAETACFAAKAISIRGINLPLFLRWLIPATRMAPGGIKGFFLFFSDLSPPSLIFLSLFCRQQLLDIPYFPLQFRKGEIGNFLSSFYSPFGNWSWQVKGSINRRKRERSVLNSDKKKLFLNMLHFCSCCISTDNIVNFYTHKGIPQYRLT